MSGETRQRLLAEMGIKPMWRLRDAPAHALPTPDVVAAIVDAGVDAERAAPPFATPELVAPKTPDIVASAPPVVAPSFVAAPPSQCDDLAWDALAQFAQDCRACGLCGQRKQAVLGSGDLQADCLVIAEAPDADDDTQGEAFAGPAGQLLDAMLASIGLSRREGVYLSHAVKCQTGGRAPAPAEMLACRSILDRQIALLQPRLIVVLGRPAAEFLLGTEIKLTSSRAKVYDYGGRPLVVSYHPAYLLRNLADKALAWEDMCFIQDTLQQSRRSEA